MQKILILLIILSSLTMACQRQLSQSVAAADQRQRSTPVSPIKAPTPTRQTTPTSGFAITPFPTPTSLIAAMPLPTPPNPLIEYYVVSSGDTLGGISLAYDISIDELMKLNNLESDSAYIQIGQTLHVPLQVSRTGPLVRLVSDSEVVYSPSYVDFDMAAFIAEKDGFLATYSQVVGGRELSAAEIIEQVAREYSVGPRVLLALIEFYGSWVTQSEPENTQSLGPANPYGDNLHLQLKWMANRLNEGYYSYKRTGSIAVQFRDRSRAIIPVQLNAGTVGIMNLLAVHTNWDTWLTQLESDGFIQTYRDLFDDPASYAIEPLIPADLQQPAMTLPWRAGKTFYYTGGPHATFADGSSWASVDFGPPDVLGSCFYSKEAITAVADGMVILGKTGEIYLDTDADGHLQTGWVLLYLHVVADDALTSGQIVSAGTPLGVASCEGGRSNSSHLHFARRYNGEWMAAGGPVPLILSGWQTSAGLGQYEGNMTRDSVIKTACECWEETNALILD